MNNNNFLEPKTSITNIIMYCCFVIFHQVELEDSRTNSRRVKKQNEKLRSEVDRLNAELAK